ERAAPCADTVAPAEQAARNPCADAVAGRERAMATNAKVGILVPGSFAGAPPTLPEFTAFFRRADDLGLHSLGVSDRIFHTVNVLDPMTLLTCAAAVPSRVRLGTSVLLFVLRNPVLMAKTTATLDYLSGGRLILGVSLGGRDNEFEPLGVSMQQRVSRLRENLAVMRQLRPSLPYGQRQHGAQTRAETPHTDPHGGSGRGRPQAQRLGSRRLDRWRSRHSRGVS